MQTPILPERVGPQDAVLLYDGLCGFCDGVVRWLLRRRTYDTAPHIYFAAQQTELGQAMLIKHGLPADAGSTVYLLVYPGTDREHLRARSAAVLRVAAMLGGVWALPATLAGVLPRGLLDAVYATVARNRYRIAGRRTACRVPTAEERLRFLDM